MMQRISVFDMLKIGVGPSSSHTMGPWRAAERFLREMDETGHFDGINQIIVELYGSLAKTGKGHGTDIAVLMGLSGEDPVTCDTSGISAIVDTITNNQQISLLNRRRITFDPATDIIFHYDQSLPYHPNGIRFIANPGTEQKEITYYSVGGGFIVKENEFDSVGESALLPYPCDLAQDVEKHCSQNQLQLWEMVWQNEQVWRSEEQICAGLKRIWETILSCAYRGCHTEGYLPGGLSVVRRASQMHSKLIDKADYNNPEEWLEYLKSRRFNFQDVVRLVSCFAMAINEENASFGRVVTAPTNGAAGVLPAVLLYYVVTRQPTDDDIYHFLLVAGEIGSFFKKGATISGAQGGCQAEIGVSSAMAAGALAECFGATVEQTLMAAEIAMEHHLGLTCDPVGGLVQIPCIERNAMGAIKAITAANIALDSSPEHARVSLDAVIATLWETAKDMSDKYKETSEGGLAALIPVNVIEC
jgi:L-serine dehydratase